MGRGRNETPEDKKYGESFIYDPDFNGPIKNRSCTDILCLALFFVFVAGWVILAIFSFVHGNPDRLLLPTDSDGNFCGRNELANKPFLYFFDLTRCVKVKPDSLFTGCPTPQVCVEKCPGLSYSAYLEKDFMLDETPLANMPNQTNYICKYDVDKSKPVRKLIEENVCAKYILKSSPVAGRCFPVSLEDLDEIARTLKEGDLEKKIAGGTRVMRALLDARNFGELIFQDFKAAWPFIAFALVLAMLFCLIWIVLMRFLAGVMVWASMLLVMGLLGFASYTCFKKYHDLNQTTHKDVELNLVDPESYVEYPKTWLAFGIISSVALGLLILILIFLRSRIILAIALIHESSKAVSSMFSTVFFPLIPFILQLAVVAFWLIVALNIASASQPTHRAHVPENCTDKGLCPVKMNDECNSKNFSLVCRCENATCQIKDYRGQNIFYYTQLYNLFGLFWGLFFMVGIGEVVLAGAFSSWYWAWDKSNVPTFVLLSSFGRTFRYHLGSIAFGSLLIAIVRMIRVILEYIDRKLKEYTDNPAVKCLMCCCKCFFWCLETFIKFINRNAYIMIAVYGRNFCASAKSAFSLLMRNVVRVVVLDKVTDFLLFLGKLTVTGAIGVLTFYFFNGKIKLKFVETYQENLTLNYVWGPVVIICFGSYIIASTFFSVYSMAVDTVFLCFLEDCERNDGSKEKPYRMSKKLMKILGKKNTFKEAS